jgi:excisionase family DNA binding protein
VAPRLRPVILPERLLRIEDVAGFLGVSRATVYKLCERGHLPHSRISNAIRIAPVDLAAFVRHGWDTTSSGSGSDSLADSADETDETTTHRYIETVSGAAKVRPELARLLADAHAGQFGAVVVWALDRLGRGGIAEIATLVKKLDAAKVALVSVKEPWADTSGPARDLLVAVMAWVAAQERARLSERTRAGLVLARARLEKEGRNLGRRPVPAHVIERGLKLIDGGKTTTSLSPRRRTPYSVHHHSNSCAKVICGASSMSGSRPLLCRSALRSRSSASRCASRFVLQDVACFRQRPAASFHLA